MTQVKVNKFEDLPVSDVYYVDRGRKIACVFKEGILFYCAIDEQTKIPKAVEVTLEPSFVIVDQVKPPTPTPQQTSTQIA